MARDPIAVNPQLFIVPSSRQQNGDNKNGVQHSHDRLQAIHYKNESYYLKLPYNLIVLIMI